MRFSFDTVLDAASARRTRSQAEKLTGYYITTTMMAKDMDAVRAALSPDGRL